MDDVDPTDRQPVNISPADNIAETQSPGDGVKLTDVARDGQGRDTLRLGDQAIGGKHPCLGIKGAENATAHVATHRGLGPRTKHQPG